MYEFFFGHSTGPNPLDHRDDFMNRPRAPLESESPFPGSLISNFLEISDNTLDSHQNENLVVHRAGLGENSLLTTYWSESTESSR